LYDYALQDPINTYDLAGQAAQRFGPIVKGARDVARKIFSRGPKPQAPGSLVSKLNVVERHAYDFILKDPNKMRKIFGNPGHSLSGLVQRLNGEENVVAAVVQAARQGPILTRSSDGIFVTARNVHGTTVTIQGRIFNGVTRVGDFLA
jgi:hypothetical protein